jgi:histidyl-tRNA synthetase
MALKPPSEENSGPGPKAETPKGFRDYFGAEVTSATRCWRTIAGVYHRYGFDRWKPRRRRDVEALGKFLPDVDRPNEGSSPGRRRTTATGWRCATT